MPTTTLYPSAAGSYSQWSITGTRPSAVQTNDGDTSFINTNTWGNRDYFAMDDMPGAAFGIVSYTGHAIVKCIGATDTYIMAVYENPNELQGSNKTAPNGVYTDQSQVFATHPNTNPWTKANVNSCEFGVRHLGTGNMIRCTQLYVVVEYTYAPGGGFAYFLSLWLPPLLAVASHGIMKREIVRVLGNLKTRPSSDEDFARLLEAFRRRPVLCGASRLAPSLP